MNLGTTTCDKCAGAHRTDRQISEPSNMVLAAECHESATPATRNEATPLVKPPKWPLLQNLPQARPCERLRTVADVNATSSKDTLSPQTPGVKREPLLRIRKKMDVHVDSRHVVGDAPTFGQVYCSYTWFMPEVYHFCVKLHVYHSYNYRIYATVIPFLCFGYAKVILAYTLYLCQNYTYTTVSRYFAVFFYHGYVIFMLAGWKLREWL
jgi:hypothetical protein